MDKLLAMQYFVKVVETGSFSKAARSLYTTQANVSKKIAALENQLNLILINRTTRGHLLTLEGESYYVTCLNVLNELEEKESELTKGQVKASGSIKISAPMAFGRILLAPLLKQFLITYSEIEINLNLSDHHVDLLSEGVDLALRAKQLEDSNLIARHLFDNQLLFFASPEYLKMYGEPKTPQDLQKQNCLIYSRFTPSTQWYVKNTISSEASNITVHGNFQSDNGEMLLEMATMGMGIVQLPIWMVNHEIQQQKLTQILCGYEGMTLPMHAVYLRQRHIPSRVRLFIDFLKLHLNDESF